MNFASRRGAGWLALAAMLLLSACASSNKPKPTPLEAVTPQIAGRQVWSERQGSVRFPLSIASQGGRFVVADGGGTVRALEAETGREAWRTDVGSGIAAGVGSDGRFAAVVTLRGELVVIEAGEVKWRKTLGARVSTPPLVAGERVFVLGVDRVVQAFDVIDGRKLWTLQRPNEPLTLAQGGLLVAFKDTLVAGQGPRMVGIDPLSGSLRWDVAVAAPRGTNEVERLADLLGPAVRSGDLVCVRAFQSAVGCVNAERGAIVWTRPAGGTQGLAGDGQLLFGADASDRLTAWRTPAGAVAWTSEKLLYRGLSAPLALGPAVVFGDAEGQVHWLSRDDGRTLLRLPTDGSAIAAAPVVSGTTMLVATRNGGLVAFRPQ